MFNKFKLAALLGFGLGALFLYFKYTQAISEAEIAKKGAEENRAEIAKLSNALKSERENDKIYAKIVDATKNDVYNSCIHTDAGMRAIADAFK